MGTILMKRFRNLVNLLLGAIMVAIFLKFIYYFFYFRGFFADYPQLIYFVRFLQVLPTPFLWFYASAIITGSIIFRKKMLLHAIPLVIGFVFFIPLIINNYNPDLIPHSLSIYNKRFGLVFAEFGGLLFIVYSRFIFREIIKIYGANISLKDCLFDFTYPHLTLVKVLSIMMNVYALVLISGGFIAFYSEGIPTYFDYTDTGFLIVLSYLMIFILVSTPKVIHYNYYKIPKSDKLLKYEKSSLSRIEAMEYVKEMNNWMESEKPFLDSNISLGNFTEKLHLPGHIISEVLNGLFKQNFYDYVNNYRIEEFKRLSEISGNISETNLNIAFEAGFNSKTTFNTAFKKFTKQTPSEFRSSLQHTI
jgi:AraC-like DNA-binding protein